MAQIKLNATYGLTGTLPAVSGVNLTALNGTQVTSGTVADARISALTSSKLTGNLPALNGSALTALNASNVASGTLNASRFSGGKVLQVLQNEQQAAISTTSSGYAICTQAITPSATSSKILIQVWCTGQHTSSSGCGIEVSREIGGGGQASVQTYTSIGSRRGVFGGQAYAGSSGDRTELMGGTFLHSPSTTSAVTYRMNTTIETGTFLINRTSDDTDNGHNIRTVSRLIVMEIGA